jgi:hypothetical protein
MRMAIVGCRYMSIEISRYRVSIYAYIDSVCVYEYVRYESHIFIDVKRICLSKKGEKCARDRARSLESSYVPHAYSVAAGGRKS